MSCENCDDGPPDECPSCEGYLEETNALRDQLRIATEALRNAEQGLRIGLGEIEATGRNEGTHFCDVEDCDEKVANALDCVRAALAKIEAK